MMIFMGFFLVIDARWTYIKHEFSQGSSLNGTGTISIPINYSYRQVFISADTQEHNLSLTVNGIKRILQNTYIDLASVQASWRSQAITFNEFSEQLNIVYQETSFRNFQIYIEQCENQYCKSCHNDARDCNECINDSFLHNCQCNQFLYESKCIKECPQESFVKGQFCYDASMIQLRLDLTIVQKLNSQSELLAYNKSQYFQLNTLSQLLLSKIQILFDITYIGQVNLSKHSYEFGLIYIMLDDKRIDTARYYYGLFERDLQLTKIPPQINRTIHSYIDIEGLNNNQLLEFKSWGNISLNWKVSNVLIKQIHSVNYDCHIDNCLSCESYNKCQVCQQEFKLYQGQCLIQCPINTYLNKENSICIVEPLQEILIQILDPFVDIFMIFQTFGKIANDKLINMKYNSQAYLQNINGTVSIVLTNVVTTYNQNSFKPHYQLRIRFILILEPDSLFKIAIDNQIINLYSHSQFIDIIKLHTSNVLYINFQCQGTCILQGYQIVIFNVLIINNQCERNCLKCTSDTCQEKVTCAVGQYFDERQGICQKCHRGCAHCTNGDDCQQCQDSVEGRIYCA